MRYLLIIYFMVNLGLGLPYVEAALPDSLQRLINTAEDDSSRYHIYRELISYYTNKNVDSALYFGIKAAAVADGGIPSERPNIYGILGLYATAKRDLEQASVYLYKALALSDELNFPIHKPGIWLNMGGLENERGNFYQADSLFHLALRGYESQKDSMGILKCYNNMANLLSHNQEPDSSLVYHFRALELARTLNKRELEFRSLLNIGVSYHFMSQKDNSYFRKALQYYQQANVIGKELKHYYGLCFMGINLGSLMRDAGILAPAIEPLKNAIPYCERSGNTEGIGSCHMILFDIYEKLGDYENALAEYKIYVNQQDTLDKQQYSKDILEVETKYETQEKDLLLIQQENQVYLLLSIVFGLALAGLIGFLILRNRQIHTKREAAVALQIQESEAQKLRELDQLKSRFFANISHEFRTPLTLILGPVRQLLKNYPSGELAKELSMVYKNGTRLRDLVSQLMDLARLESGKMQLSLQAGDVMAFIRGIAHSFASMADLKEIQYDIDIADQALLTSFDPDKLQSILANLLSNAFKYTQEEGQVRLLVRTVEQENKLEISISDNGMGIPAEKLPHIFERFYTDHAIAPCQRLVTARSGHRSRNILFDRLFQPGIF